MGENITKTEFVDRLCRALNPSGDAGLVERNRAYYNEYIDGEIAKGRTEEEILAELGEPELIALSILNANGYRDRFVDDDSKTFNAYDTPDGDPNTFAQGMQYHGKGKSEKGESDAGNTRDINDGTAKKKGLSPKAKLIIILIVAALILIGIIVLIVLAIGGILKFFWPVLIPLIIIYIIYKIAKTSGRK